MDEAPKPLTDAQIRAALLTQTETMLHARMDLLVLQRALLNKNLLTESDIDEAHRQVELEAKETMKKLGDAAHRGPAGGIQ